MEMCKNMEKLDIRKKLINDYELEETRIKEVARGSMSSFLGVNMEDVSVRDASPHDKGILIYLNVGDLQFTYAHPSGKIEFSLDGNLYPVEKRADVGRIISFQENKYKPR
jgi:hypothetical protein